MLLHTCVLLALLPAGGGADPSDAAQRKPAVSPVLDFQVQRIDGTEVHLGEYQGQVLLIVNVASRCGFTPQYADLEALYRKHKDAGLRILAFPANNFGGQEPGTNKEILTFCTSTYNVTFDLFSKVSVKGTDICPLYRYLTDPQKTAEYGGDIKWNFEKFLVDRSGAVVGRFGSREAPLGEKLTTALQAALQAAPTSSRPR